MEDRHILYVMRHFGTNENRNGVYMGQRDCPIKGSVSDIAVPGSFVRGKRIKVFCSPLKRAVQSAEVLFKQYPDVDWDLEILDSLKERGLGEFEGKVKSTLNSDRRYFDSMKRLDLNTTPPGAESIYEFRNRVLQSVPIIEKALVEYDVLLVTHLQVLRILESFYTAKDSSQWYNIFYPTGIIERLKQ